MVLDVAGPGAAPEHQEAPWFDVELGHHHRSQVPGLVQVRIVDGWKALVRIEGNVPRVILVGFGLHMEDGKDKHSW